MTAGSRLGLEPGMAVALLHAPDGIEAVLGPPDGVRLQHGLRRSDRVDRIVGFVTERDHLARNIGWLVTTLTAGGVFWVAWPTPASGVATDLDEAAIEEAASPLGWVGRGWCRIDGTWSALALVQA